jgi:hypothetical protein
MRDRFIGAVEPHEQTAERGSGGKVIRLKRYGACKRGDGFIPAMKKRQRRAAIVMRRSAPRIQADCLVGFEHRLGQKAF